MVLQWGTTATEPSQRHDSADWEPELCSTSQEDLRFMGISVRLPEFMGAPTTRPYKLWSKLLVSSVIALYSGPYMILT